MPRSQMKWRWVIPIVLMPCRCNMGFEWGWGAVFLQDTSETPIMWITFMARLRINDRKVDNWLFILSWSE